MRIVLALACLVGCDKVYGLDRPPEDAADAPVDAFDRASCPANYTLQPATLPSAYRIIIAAAAAGLQLQECDGDEPGITHLAQLDSQAETAYLAGQLQDVTLTNAWIGGVQPVGNTVLADGWIGVDGTPLISTLWGSSEPNDFDGAENGQENFARLDIDRLFLIDIADYIASPAICECDGRASDPSFVRAYTQ